MTPNVGSFDRVLRFALGIVLIALPFVAPVAMLNGTLATVILVVVGAVMVLTAAIRFCPLYTILGIRTCRV